MNVLAQRGGVEFYITESYTLEDLRRVQERSIEMYQQIASVLDRHGIAYTLGYGSLLGQVRHGGYIPWDDDIDLFIFEEDYGRAILSLRRELPENLLLHNKRNDRPYWVTWVKVRDLQSDTVESMWKIDRKLRYHGVAIDLIRVSDSTVGRHHHSPAIRELGKRRQKSIKRQRARRGAQRFTALPRFVVDLIALEVKTIVRRLRRKAGQQEILVIAPGTIIEKTVPRDAMFPLRRDGPTFEGMVVPSPSDPHRVLTAMYGDYRSLPPLEERIPHFESVRFFDD